MFILNRSYESRLQPKCCFVRSDQLTTPVIKKKKVFGRQTLPRCVLFVLFHGFVNDHTFGHTDDIHLTFKCLSFQGTIKALLLKLLCGVSQERDKLLTSFCESEEPENLERS